MVRLKSGSVHGRFQPFHNGHLDYVLQAFKRAEFIYVGLTQVIQPNEDSVAGRDSFTANPLTYRERSILVRAALNAVDIPDSRFVITPFPIECVELLPQFVPTEVPCFTTIVNEWNEEKIRRLILGGYDVKTLEVSVPDNVRVTSGTEIRRLLRAGDPSWARFVPPAVGEIISDRFKGRF